MTSVAAPAPVTAQTAPADTAPQGTTAVAETTPAQGSAINARATTDGTKEGGAKLLPPGVGKGQLLSDMQHDPRYKPRLPPELNFAGSVVWGLFKLCVNADGQVASVAVLKSAHHLVDDPWVAVLRTLQHKPYSIGGRAVPYCYPMRLEVRSQPAPQPPRR
jgi:outer membrane biosynthesis protein TonB